MPAPDRGTPVRIEPNPVRFARGVQGVYSDTEIDGLLEQIITLPWVETAAEVPAGLPTGTAYLVGPKPGPYALYVESEFVGGTPGPDR